MLSDLYSGKVVNTKKNDYTCNLHESVKFFFQTLKASANLIISDTLKACAKLNVFDTLNAFAKLNIFDTLKASAKLNFLDILKDSALNLLILWDDMNG